MRGEREVKEEGFKPTLSKVLENKKLIPIKFSRESSNIFETKLDVKAPEESSTLNFSERLISKDSQFRDDLSNLYKEIQKEEKVMSVKNQTDSRFQSLSQQHLGKLQNKSKSPLEKFNELKAQIQKNQSQARGRSKRSTQNQVLTQDQRETLQKFYELYLALNKTKAEISSQLQRALPDDVPLASAQTSQQDDKSTTILTSLFSLGWTNGSLRSIMRAEDLKHFYKNPQDATNALTSLAKIRSEVQTQLRNNERNYRAVTYFRTQGGRAEAAFYQDNREQKQRLADASGDIQITIASKLLELMEQLNNN